LREERGKKWEERGNSGEGWNEKGREGTPKGWLTPPTFEILKNTLQVGSIDCGLFAIMRTYCLARGDD